MLATIQEAEATFDELIARAEAGEEIVIVDGNRPVARLVALTEEEKRALALTDTNSAFPSTATEDLG